MKNKLSRFAVPYEVWMAIFVVAPIVIMVVYAFSSADGGFTLDNFVQMGGYTEVFLRSFKLAIIATVICLLIGYPVSYLMSREGASFQRTAMVLIMLPMWMNFLLRTYSWMTILENNGLLNQLFQKIGLISLYNHIFGTNLEYFPMMNTQGAVVLGMVYNYLPFMILPIYSVIIKLDHSLLEAARDLGAGSLTVFRRVILPLSLPGVVSGITMVFVPSVSTFAISRMLGGGTELLLGNMPGSLGEVAALALLAGFAYLLWRRVIRWHVPVTVLATMAVFAFVYALGKGMTGAALWQLPLFHVLAGGAILGAVFMATDYSTSPMTVRGGVIFAAGIGVITMLIRLWGAYPEGMSFAILIMNACVPLINKYVKPKRFGVK